MNIMLCDDMMCCESVEVGMICLATFEVRRISRFQFQFSVKKNSSEKNNNNKIHRNNVAVGSCTLKVREELIHSLKSKVTNENHLQRSTLRCPIWCYPVHCFPRTRRRWPCCWNSLRLRHRAAPIDPTEYATTSSHDLHNVRNQ